MSTDAIASPTVWAGSAPSPSGESSPVPGDSPDSALAPSADRTIPDRQRAALGVIYGIAAFGAWGLFPIYFKAVSRVAPLEVMAHRAIWSAVFLLLVMGARSELAQVVAILREPRRAVVLLASTMLLAANWLLFIWAVAHKLVLQASLGYFINPLVNVLLAMLFLRERLRLWQWVGIAITTAGVTFQSLRCGGLPWIALLLAITFSSYGLIRKVVKADAMAGLTVETLLMAPFAIAYVVWSGMAGHAAFAAGDTRINLLLLSAGVLTSVPLIWFVNATRRLRYTTVGVLQYLAPTGQFLLAVLAYDEPFTRQHLLSFTLVWTGIAVYLAETNRRVRAERRAAVPAAA